MSVQLGPAPLSGRPSSSLRSSPLSLSPTSASNMLANPPVATALSPNIDSPLSQDITAFTSGVHQQPWKLRAAKKKAAQEALIPPEWRLPHPVASYGDDVREVPSLCGIMDLIELEITDLDDASTLLGRVASGSYTTEAVVVAYCKRAAIAQQLTNCLTEILFAPAVTRAKSLDDHFARTGKVVGPLQGLVVSLKDQFDIKGFDSTMGFVSLINKPATQNCALVEILESLGAIVHCKTNVPQTLMAEESNNNIFGRTVNPRNRNLISGGSSGGEGALVAMKGSMVGFGTDFAGGSIRKPSAYCGLYGLRPTTRRLPYEGVSNVLKGFEGIESVIGPMARSISTLKTVSEAIITAEPWLLDSRVIEKPWTPTLVARKLRVALLPSDGCVHNTPPIQRGLYEVASALKKAGHEVVKWSPFDHVYIQQLFGDIASADGGADLRSFLIESNEPVIPEAFPFVALEPRSVYETSQLIVKRNRFRQDVLKRCMNRPEGPIDLIVCPLTPHPAPPPLGAPRPAELISWTTIWSLADLPACTLPVGQVDPVKDAPRAIIEEPFNEFDLAHWTSYHPSNHVNAPIVLQLIGPRRLGEESLLGMAAEVEKALKNF
ncbi:amidase [Meredithblackwellia eburnea MCA 4105]